MQVVLIQCSFLKIATSGSYLAVSPHSLTADAGTMEGEATCSSDCPYGKRIQLKKDGLHFLFCWIQGPMSFILNYTSSILYSSLNSVSLSLPATESARLANRETVHSSWIVSSAVSYAAL